MTVYITPIKFVFTILRSGSIGSSLPSASGSRISTGIALGAQGHTIFPHTILAADTRIREHDIDGFTWRICDSSFEQSHLVRPLQHIARRECCFISGVVVNDWFPKNRKVWNTYFPSSETILLPSSGFKSPIVTNALLKQLIYARHQDLLDRHTLL